MDLQIVVAIDGVVSAFLVIIALMRGRLSFGVKELRGELHNAGPRARGRKRCGRTFRSVIYQAGAATERLVTALATLKQSVEDCAKRTQSVNTQP